MFLLIFFFFFSLLSDVMGLVVRWGFQGEGKGREGAKKKERIERKERTAGQQNPPQQDSPATQNVSPQQVDPTGMQKGSKSEEVGIQHWTVFFPPFHVSQPISTLSRHLISSLHNTTRHNTKIESKNRRNE